MAKLTNREIGVLASTISNKINTKKLEFKETEGYQALLAQAKITLKYDEVSSLLTTCMSIQLEIENLNTRKNLLLIQLRGVRGSTINIYNTSTLDNLVIQKADEELIKIFPTQKNLEDDIILLSLTNGTDILDILMTKYNLTNE